MCVHGHAVCVCVGCDWICAYGVRDKTNGDVRGSEALESGAFLTGLKQKPFTVHRNSV